MRERTYWNLAALLVLAAGLGIAVINPSPPHCGPITPVGASILASCFVHKGDPGNWAIVSAAVGVAGSLILFYVGTRRDPF
jgi:hypothetical protein